MLRLLSLLFIDWLPRRIFEGKMGRRMSLEIGGFRNVVTLSRWRQSSSLKGVVCGGAGGPHWGTSLRGLQPFSKRTVCRAEKFWKQDAAHKFKQVDDAIYKQYNDSLSTVARPQLLGEKFRIMWSTFWLVVNKIFNMNNNENNIKWKTGKTCRNMLSLNDGESRGPEKSGQIAGQNFPLIDRPLRCGPGGRRIKCAVKIAAF